jgi:hypothetical protein
VVDGRPQLGVDLPGERRETRPRHRIQPGHPDERRGGEVTDEVLDARHVLRPVEECRVEAEPLARAPPGQHEAERGEQHGGRADPVLGRPRTQVRPLPLGQPVRSPAETWCTSELDDRQLWSVREFVQFREPVGSVALPAFLVHRIGLAVRDDVEELGGRRRQRGIRVGEELAPLPHQQSPAREVQHQHVEPDEQPGAAVREQYGVQVEQRPLVRGPDLV